MAISTGNRPKGLITGMSAVDAVSPAEGPLRQRPKAQPRLPKPKRRAKARGSALLAAMAKLGKA